MGELEGLLEDFVPIYKVQTRLGETDGGSLKPPPVSQPSIQRDRRVIGQILTPQDHFPVSFLPRTAVLVPAGFH